jgi:hypothetical protein
MFRSTRSLALVAVTALAAAGCAESVAPRPTAAEVAGVCAGISDAPAQDFLTDLRDDVDGIEAVRATTTTKPIVTHSVGADVHLRARPGMTAQWLARLAECHAAREAAGVACTSSECPLRLARVTTSVSPTATGFTLAIRTDDPAVAHEIVRRAEIVLRSQSPQAAATR